MKKVLVSAIIATFTVPAYLSAAVTVDTVAELQSALNSKQKRIYVDGTLKYSGSTPLVLKGKGHRVYADGNNTVLHVTNGADLKVSGLRFIGPGGYSYDDSNPNQSLGGNAILLTTPAIKIDESGEDDPLFDKVVKVEIYNTSVRGFGDHGIHLSDCSDLSCGDGNDAGGFGTSASFDVKLTKVTVMNTGFGQQDADGIRVDERSDGSVNLVAKNIWLRNVGADGIEIDEAGDGDVIVKMKNANFVDNGSYCGQADQEALFNVYTEARSVAEPFENKDLEKEFLEDFAGRYDCVDEIDTDEEGKDQVVFDLDDAFDIDEADRGSVSVEMKNIRIFSNDDEGLDFDEDKDGDITLDAQNIIMANNGDEGIKLSEEDDGDVNLTVKKLTNGRGEADDIEVESEDDGAGSVTINNAKIDDLKITGTVNCDLSNVKFDGKIKDDGCANLP